MTDAAVAVQLLAHSGFMAWRATLVGSPPPFVRAIHDRMRSPQLGDVVLEVTHRKGAPTWDPDAVGVLVYRPFGEPGVWRIRPLVPSRRDRPVVTWENCEFIALPDGADWLPL